MKTFTINEVYVLVLAILVDIAIIETDGGAMWTWVFWRQFLLNIMLYGLIVEVLIIGWAGWAARRKKDTKD